MYLSVVTLAELRYCAKRLESGGRKSRLDMWLREEFPQRFEGRLLAIVAAIADCWGRVTNNCAAAGRPIGVMGAFFAATAEINGLTLVLETSLISLLPAFPFLIRGRKLLSLQFQHNHAVHFVSLRLWHL